MILQKSFLYADVLKKHFLLLSVLKTVVLINIFVEHTIFSVLFDEQKAHTNIIYLKNKSCVTFDQFNASMLNKN